MTPTPLNRKARRAAERATQLSPASKTQLTEPQPQLSVLTPARASEPRALASGSISPSPVAVAHVAHLSLASQMQLTEPRPPESVLTPARLDANRANAQLSTGPKSETGKANSSKNAKDEAASFSEPKIQRVTALTGRTVLLPEDDADRYERHLNEYKKAYQPVGEREYELVQSLADTTWRIDRIPGLEEAIYARGCIEFAAEVSDLDPQVRSASLRMRTYLAYERQLRNLNLQEMRLHRLREKLIAGIKQLQKEREQKEKDDLAIAAKLYVAAKHDRKPSDPSDRERIGRLVPVVRDSKEDGFEFSTADLEGYLHGQRAAFPTEQAMSRGNGADGL